MADEREIDAYYSHLFPKKELCDILSRKWLGASQLHLREIALELHGNAYVRYLSVSSPEDLLRLLTSKRPAKVHAGAVFSERPEHKKKGVVVEPRFRELVFDIDVDDFTKFGVDKNDLAACNAAWPLVAFGLHVLKLVLKRHFGFSHALAVYSGRRGAHLSVFDKRACELSNEARSAIVAFLQPSGSAGRPLFDSLIGSHCFARIYKENVLVFWESICLSPRGEGGLGVLDTKRDRDDFVACLNCSERSNPLCLAAVSGAAAWSCVLEYVRNARFRPDAEKKLKRAVLTYVWPRLDANVTKQIGHLSKVVFSVHPATGLVCVPIRDLTRFDPKRCPSVRGLLAGDKADTAAFEQGVALIGSFVNKLALSSSERWVRPVADAPPGHFRMPASLAGRKRSLPDSPDQNAYFYADRPRFCWLLQRVFFAVACDGAPSKVQLCFFTQFGPASEAVQQVNPGYSPPFRKSRRFPARRFVLAASEAAQHPGKSIVATRAFVCALLHPRTTSRAAAEARLDSLRGGLLQATFVCDFDTRWSQGEKLAMLEAQAQQHWEVQRVLLR